MNRLAVRVVLSHLLVALLGVVAAYLVVRQLAPALFDEELRRGYQGGRNSDGRGAGSGFGLLLRETFAHAVSTSVLVGGLVGVVAATAAGTLAATRLLRPLARVREATRRMAQGRYDVPVQEPRERELAGLARDVNTLGEALASTEQRRVRLLSEVAHEMRTPLTVIDGQVEAMIDGVLPASASELSQVSAEVRRLRRLADDLSALSRTEEGRLHLVIEQVDLRSVVSRAAERLRPQVSDAGVELTVRVGSVPVPAAVDPDRIAQVVTNLVGNAVRATPSGGRIEVSVEPGQRDPSLPVAWVRVTDSGVGLSSQDLERVFERFYRVPAGITEGPHHGTQPAPRHDRGSGIGLTIARGIVRAHGGDLQARSPGLGQGATFEAWVPMVTPEAAAAEASEAPSSGGQPDANGQSP